MTRLVNYLYSRCFSKFNLVGLRFRTFPEQESLSCWGFLGLSTQHEAPLNHCDTHTVDGRNPAPVDRWFIPLFTRLCTSQVVVWDFWTINSSIDFLLVKLVIFLRDSFWNGIHQLKYSPPFTPLKINMDHNHGGLEDHFLSKSPGGSILIFQGVNGNIFGAIFSTHPKSNIIGFQGIKETPIWWKSSGWVNPPLRILSNEKKGPHAGCFGYFYRGWNPYPVYVGILQ